jgi:hypothetical protein
MMEGCLGLTVADDPTVPVLTDGDFIVSEIARRLLGYQVQFPVNRLAEGVHQKDQLMDDLFTLFRGTPAYNSVREAVFAYSAIKSPLCTYMQGICSYIEGHYLKSAEYFLDALSVHPDNVDLWRYFAFALRHGGYYNASNAVFFHLAQCIAYTQRSFISSRLKPYAGWKCPGCGSLIVHTLPIGYSQCSGCGGTALTKVSVDMRVFSRPPLNYMVADLEQVGALPQEAGV